MTPRRTAEKVIEGFRFIGLQRYGSVERWLVSWESVLREDKDWNAGREVEVGSKLCEFGGQLSNSLRGLGL